MAELKTGEIFAGKHRLDRLLGGGAFSEVWKTTHETLGQEHAVKVMHETLKNPVLVRRFISEARTMAALRHENLVRVLDAGVEDGRPYLVMEYHESTDLRQLFCSGVLGKLRSLEIAADILRGLAAAHEHGVLHRDVKPENVLVGADGITRLTDFGIAKSMDVGAGMTKAGDAMGTPRYMAPEQKGALLQARIESDLYAVGLIIYELLGGEIPTDLRATVDLFVAEVRAIKLMSFPPVVRRLIERSTMYSPEDRYRSAEEMLGAVISARRQLERELRGVSAPSIPGPPVIAPTPEPAPPVAEVQSPPLEPAAPEAVVEAVSVPEPALLVPAAPDPVVAEPVTPAVVVSEVLPRADSVFGFDPYGDVPTQPVRRRRPALYAAGILALLALAGVAAILLPSDGDQPELVEVEPTEAAAAPSAPVASTPVSTASPEPASSGVLPRPTPIFSSETSTSSTAGGPPGRVTPTVAESPTPTAAAPAEKPKPKPTEVEKPFQFTPVTVFVTPTITFQAKAWPGSKLLLRYRVPGEPYQEPRSFKEVSPGQFEVTLSSAPFAGTGFDYFVEAAGPAGQTEKTATYKVRGP